MEPESCIKIAGMLLKDAVIKDLANQVLDKDEEILQLRGQCGDPKDKTRIERMIRSLKEIEQRATLYGAMIGGHNVNDIENEMRYIAQIARGTLQEVENEA